MNFDSKRQEKKLNNLLKKYLFAIALIYNIANIILEFPIRLVNQRESYIYSQFYSKVQVLFNIARLYLFDNIKLESLAIDFIFIKSVIYTSSIVVFDTKTYKQGYLNNKN